ncbi:MAG: hypothetical protein ACUVWP_01985 [bacterium]
MKRITFILCILLFLSALSADIRIAVCPINVYSPDFKGNPTAVLEGALTNLNVKVIGSNVMTKVMKSLWLLPGEEEEGRHVKDICSIVYADLLVVGRFAQIGDEWTWGLKLLSGNDGGTIWEGYLTSKEFSVPSEFIDIVSENLVERLEPPPKAVAIDPLELAKYLFQSGEEVTTPIGSEPKISIMPTAIEGDVNISMLNERLSKSSGGLLRVLKDAYVSGPVVIFLDVSNGKIVNSGVEGGGYISGLSDWASQVNLKGIGGSSFKVYITVGYMR